MTQMPQKTAGSAFGRRGLLRLASAAGAAQALTPFLPLLQSDAEAAGFPKRLLLIYIPLGSRYAEFHPTGTENDFTLGKNCLPLEKYKSDCIFLDGMDNVAVSGGPARRGHPSVNCVFTGAPHAADSTNSGNGNIFGWPTGPSVDQYVAQEIAKVAPTPLSSLETGFAIEGDYRSRISFKAANQPVPPLDNPAEVFKKVFADLKLDPGRLEAMHAKRRSVIDVVKGDLGRISARVPAVDRPKLQAHLESIRAIESRLAVSVGTCSRIPAQPGTAVLEPPAAMDTFGALITSAFACNLTRVASIIAAKEERGLSKAGFLRLVQTHHEVSHRIDPVGYEELNRCYTWYMEQLALLIEKMKTIPEGNGTMLDNTVIVAASNMGNADKHNIRGVPVVVAGSCGGAFKTGRYLRFGNYQSVYGTDKDHGGQPLNNLLVSVCNAMGFPVTTFGDKRYCTGPLPGLG